MDYDNKKLIQIISRIDLGSSIAEQDTLLERARVETSAFSDLLNDKVDLLPGTKGSGKSALYRIFVEFLPDYLLRHQKVVIAHGVDRHGDSVFHAFNDRFKKLDEDDFVNFWCIYFVSMVHEQFIKNARYNIYLSKANQEIRQFLYSCQQAYIPEIQAKKSIKEVLEWTLSALSFISPKVKCKMPDIGAELTLDFFGAPYETKTAGKDVGSNLPRYVVQIRDDLEQILTKTSLNIWLMIDKLDEIFPRRSDLERTALRGLLRTMRIFTSSQIRIKIFLRDDILQQIVNGSNGFTALTHITAREADTLRWSEDQILTMIINRIFADSTLLNYLQIDTEKLNASLEYRMEAFYKVFPPSVHKGSRQSNTLSWIYNHTADGNGVVTPRDVIDLLTKAKQHQHNIFISNTSGKSPWIIGGQSIQYGLSELSKRKRTTYLQAEFPHLWVDIEKFMGGKTEYTEAALRKLLGRNWKDIVNDLSSIGLLSKGRSKGQSICTIPFLYRKGLELTQGRSD